MEYALRRSWHSDGPAGPKTLGERPACPWSLIWFTFSPLYVLFTDWKPFLLTLLQAAVFVVPILVLLLIWLTNTKKLMGEYVNGWASNIVLAFIALTSAYLMYQSVATLWTSKPIH